MNPHSQLYFASNRQHDTMTRGDIGVFILVVLILLGSAMLS